MSSLTIIGHRIIETVYEPATVPAISPDRKHVYAFCGVAAKTVTGRLSEQLDSAESLKCSTTASSGGVNIM